MIRRLTKRQREFVAHQLAVHSLYWLLLGAPELARDIARQVRTEREQAAAIAAWEDDGGAVAPEREPLPQRTP